MLQPSKVLDVVLGHLEALDFGLLGGLGHKEVLRLYYEALESLIVGHYKEALGAVLGGFNKPLGGPECCPWSFEGS